jgi:DedD protein
MTENTAASDSDLQLKKRARRRLVGAIALALLAAIVLPMVMDHEPRPAQQDIQVRIPSQDAGSFTSRVLPGTPTATPLPPVADVKKPEPKPESKPEAAPQEDVTAPILAPKPESKPVAKPEVKPDTKSAEALRAEKILAGGEAPKAEAQKADNGTNGQWVLQLGAYAESGNVKVLQGKIKELGYSSYTEKVSTPQGERIRVRAGPFSSKAAAEKAQTRLKQIGAGGPPGGVVAPK